MRRGATFILAAATAVVAACGAGPRPQPAPAPPPPADAAPAVAPVPARVAPPLPDGAITEDELMADVAWLCDPARAGRGSFDDGGRVTADWIADRFEALGLRVSRQSIPGGADNVFGVLPGGAEKGDRAVVIAAHYDHLGVGLDGVMRPGADDNASGTAALLAVARALQGYRGGHTVVFVAFGAEELGLLGSAAYMRDPPWPLERTVAMLNFDMIGRNFFELVGGKPDAVAVIGLEASARVSDAVVAAAEAEGLELFVVSAALIHTLRMDARTDDWWFRERGVPTAHFSTGMHHDYHQPSDTPDKLRPRQIRLIARTAARALIDLADLSPPPS